MSGLSYEALRPSHAALLYPHLSDARLYAFIPEDPPVSATSLEERYRFLVAGPPCGEERWLNYVLCEGGHPVGTLQATVQADGVALIAYMVFAQSQRRGYARAGCRWLLEQLFSRGEVHTVRAHIDTENAASIALAESLGLRRVTTLVEADHFKGRSSDEFVYEMDRSDYDSSGTSRGDAEPTVELDRRGLSRSTVEQGTAPDSASRRR